jgi:hypothetical protein
MPIDPQQLLALAKRLADTPGASEADLRRGISTAYYAVFHMLINEVTSSFVIASAFRSRVARALQHGPMKGVCVRYNPEKPNKKSGNYETVEADGFPAQTLTPELRKVAEAFVQLHAAREEADYDGGTTVQPTAAATAVQWAEDAFQAWIIAQTDPSSNTFLQELFWKSIMKR